MIRIFVASVFTFGAAFTYEGDLDKISVRGPFVADDGIMIVIIPSLLFSFNTQKIVWAIKKESGAKNTFSCSFETAIKLDV